MKIIRSGFIKSTSFDSSTCPAEHVEQQDNFMENIPKKWFSFHQYKIHAVRDVSPRAPSEMLELAAFALTHIFQMLFFFHLHKENINNPKTELINSTP